MCCADGTRPFRGVCYNPQKIITPTVEMAMAAIQSARANTSLDIAVMYDGDAPEFLDFLAAHDVRCIQQRFSLADDPTFWPDPGAPTPKNPRGLPLQFVAQSLCGTFMRFDVPGLFPEEDYILYTDTDVIFQRDPVPLLQVERPEFIAGVSYGKASCWPVGPKPQSRRYINAGVLLINVQAWIREFDALVATSKRFEWGSIGSGWNEGVINQHFDKRIKFLRRTFNWRPWMGVFEAAPIVHYHGARPAHLIEYLEWGIESPDLPGFVQRLWQAGGSGYGQHAAESPAVDMTRDIARHYVNLYEEYSPGARDIPMDLWPTSDRGLLFHKDIQQRYGVSEEWCGYLKKYAGLTPSSDVLELGFGAGRTARVLWDYISPAGSYCGVEVNEDMVDWHSHNITSRRPNLRFFHADVTNAAYRRDGCGDSPSKYAFPFDDKSFDVIFLASVFTHMFPADVANYLQEIRRVLRPGGCVLASCFLLDDGVQKRMEEDVSAFQFVRMPEYPHTWAGYHRSRPDNAGRPDPEACLGYSAAAHCKLYKDTELDVIHLFFGSWSGVDPDRVSRHASLMEQVDGKSACVPPFTGQDIVVAQRPKIAFEEYFEYCGATEGSSRWELACKLITLEQCYMYEFSAETAPESGAHPLYGRQVKRRKFSPSEPSPPVSVENWGGERMLLGKYAYEYAAHLPSILEKDDTDVVVEVGILKGTGLAALADLFPANPVYGLDIDISYAEENLPALKAQGAFQNNNLELTEYDQFVDNSSYLKKILRGRKVKYVADDGYHSDETALMTLHSFYEHLADNFVYVIEDNRTVHTAIAAKYPQFSIHKTVRAPALTILTRRDA